MTTAELGVMIRWFLQENANYCVILVFETVIYEK